MGTVDDRTTSVAAATSTGSDGRPGSPHRVRGWWWLMLLAAMLGMAATTSQIVERIKLAEDPGADLLCNVNSTLSCTGALTAWQASVFGPIPNAAIGLTVFTILMTTAAGGLLGVAFSKRAWGVAAFFAGFMAAFTVWFLAASTFQIERICLYCLVNGTMVLLINLAVWRAGNGMGFLDSGNRLSTTAGSLVRGGTDVFIWGGLGVIIVAMMVAKFGLG